MKTYKITFFENSGKFETDHTAFTSPTGICLRIFMHARPMGYQGEMDENLKNSFFEIVNKGREVSREMKKWRYDHFRKVERMENPKFPGKKDMYHETHNPKWRVACTESQERYPDGCVINLNIEQMEVIKKVYGTCKY